MGERVVDNTEYIKEGPTVAILDAGAQYGGLIDRVVWEGGIRTKMLPLDTPYEELGQYGAVIITGGPSSVYEADSPDCDPRLFSGDIPVLGICYGMQLMAKHCGGQIEKSDIEHNGVYSSWVLGASPLYAGLAHSQDVLLTHSDVVSVQPPDFRVSAADEDTILGFENVARKLYATQFHPESSNTASGEAIIKNFVTGIAGIEPYMTTKDLETESINYIKDYVGDREVMLFLSGGVDSTVLAALVAKAINPAKIHAFHIDTGFMRLHESDSVLAALADAGIEVEVIEASSHFFGATTTDKDGSQLPVLSEAYLPEEKRKIIGDAFMSIREQIVARYGLLDDIVLAQGSLRPDLIESGSLLASATGHADVIKTHHNDTQAVRQLRDQGKVCEPLQSFYKDQVRQLGRGLGLPDDIVDRQPFPGPGLAIRILCHPGENLPKSTVAIEVIDGTEYMVQSLPIQTVGVKGDVRSYKPIMGIHADFNQSANTWTDFEKFAKTYTQDHDINRVVAIKHREPVYRITEPRLTRTTLSDDTVELLRGADAVINELLRQYGLDTSLSQVPVILTPLSFRQNGHYSIALRPFISPDFMTGRAALPGKDLPVEFPEIAAQKLFEYSPLIDAVMYDLSSKPPGTTEWE